MYTIEYNISEEPMEFLARWHISRLENTLKTNIENMINEKNRNPWILVGVENSHKQTKERIKILKMLKNG